VALPVSATGERPRWQIVKGARTRRSPGREWIFEQISPSASPLARARPGGGRLRSGRADPLACGASRRAASPCRAARARRRSHPFGARVSSILTEPLPRYGIMACWNTKGWQGARVRRFGGNSLVAILPHYLTTSGSHPRPQFHELHPQVLQGALVVGDLTLDIRQLEFKYPDFIIRRHWRPQDARARLAETSGSAAAARKGQSDGWRTRINNGSSGKRGELPPENPGFLGAPGVGRGASVPLLTPPVQASSLSL
jgi:hypothetical protein